MKKDKEAARAEEARRRVHEQVTKAVLAPEVPVGTFSTIPTREVSSAGLERTLRALRSEHVVVVVTDQSGARFAECKGGCGRTAMGNPNDIGPELLKLDRFLSRSNLPSAIHVVG